MNKQKEIEENEKEIRRVKDKIRINKEERSTLRSKKWYNDYYLSHPESFIKEPPTFTKLDMSSLTEVEDHITRLEGIITDLEEYYWVLEAKDDY